VKGFLILAICVTLSGCGTTYQYSCKDDLVYKKEAQDSYWMKDIHHMQGEKYDYVRECIADK